MKQCIKIISIILVVIALCPISVYAQEQENTDRIVFDDGSYVIVEVSVVPSRATTKVASKHYTYYSVSDVKQWKATVTGTFTYDGSSSQCTAVDTSFTRYTTTWALDSVSKYKSGNKAFADFYVSSGGIETSVRVTVTCDKNGNVT